MGRFKLAAGAVLLVLCASSFARAQFFLGSPNASFGSTSGTVTSTPTPSANQPLREIDMSGQFIVQNATPTVQTSSFTASCALDPTFNGGTPLSMQLRIDQNGFVNVPVGGQIYGWTITASIVDNTGVDVSGSTAIANAPAGPYFAGTTTYGPTTTFGPSFVYNPVNSSELVLTFSSQFDGLVPANSYTWDFPLSVQVIQLPEPASAALAIFASAITCKRRRT